MKLNTQPFYGIRTETSVPHKLRITLMGGSISRPREESSTTGISIPSSKCHDAQYLTNILLSSLAEENNAQVEEKTTQLSRAACDALKNMSDSYAYSEEMISCGSISPLLQLACRVLNTDEEMCRNHSTSVELALACAATLLYMLEESSAPSLFRLALLPLLQERNTEGNVKTDDPKKEELLACLKRINFIAWNSCTEEAR